MGDENKIYFQCMRFVLILFTKLNLQLQFPDIWEFADMSSLAFDTWLSYRTAGVLSFY